MNRALLTLALLACGCTTTSPAAGPPRAAPASEVVREADRLRRSGWLDSAIALYGEALARDPGSVRGHAGLQAARLARGEDLTLRREYRRLGDGFLLGRLEGDPERAEAGFARAEEPWRSFGLAGLAVDEGDLAEARALFRRSLRADPGLAAARLGLGRVRLAEGALGLAEAQFLAAAWNEPEHPTPFLGLSAVADRRGDLEGAYRWALEAYDRAPAEASIAARAADLAARSGREDWMIEAGRKLVAKGAANPETRLRGAGLLAKAGRPGEARAAFEAVRNSVAAAEIEAYRPGGVAPEVAGFAAALAEGVEARYRHYAATGEAEGFDEFVDWARGLYERTTGEALGPRGSTIAYAFVGRLVDPTLESDEPLVLALAKAGLFLVLGQRTGGPPEAMLADVVRREPRCTVARRGVVVEREAVWIGRRHLSGYLEWSGLGDIAGVALERVVVVDLHAVATWEGSLRRAIARLSARASAEPALADAPVTAVDDPAGVALRLLEGGDLDLAREVLVHEEAHLVDAARHLPVGSHPLRNLGLAVTRGFSAGRIMAYLERNAQLTALAEGPTPRSALATCCFLLGESGPHASGYTEIVAAMVREIHRAPGDYPEIDHDRLIVQQLDRLPAERIRELAVAVQRRWGLAE